LTDQTGKNYNKNMKNNKAQILTIKDLPKLRYPLPESLIKAAGLMKHKRKELEEHLEQVRNEWDRKV